MYKDQYGQIKWRPSWMLSWLPWIPPGCQMSTLTKNKLETSPDTIQPRNALDKKCTQITPGTVLYAVNQIKSGIFRYRLQRIQPLYYYLRCTFTYLPCIRCVDRVDFSSNIVVPRTVLGTVSVIFLLKLHQTCMIFLNQGVGPLTFKIRESNQAN